MDVARGPGRLVSVIGLAVALLLVPAPVLADCQLAPSLDKAMGGLRPPAGLAPERTPSSQTGPLSALGDISGPLLVAAIVGGLRIVAVLVARRRET